jgi:hypothetical protein
MTSADDVEGLVDEVDKRCADFARAVPSFSPGGLNRGQDKIADGVLRCVEGKGEGGRRRRSSGVRVLDLSRQGLRAKDRAQPTLLES